MLLVFLMITMTVLITTQAYNFPQASRRAWIRQTTAAAVAISTQNIAPANAVISSKGCVYGEGDGCQDLAEGNPLILELQAKSAQNRQANELVRVGSLCSC